MKATIPSQPQTTDKKHSMPPRGSAPGLKRGRHKLPYWIARQVVRNPMGYPDLCIPLQPELDKRLADLRKIESDVDEGAVLAEICREHTARLHAWIAKAQTEGPAETVTRYDRTVGSACRIYQEHPLSPFHDVKHNTKRTYTSSLKLIEETVGKRLVPNVTVPLVKNWYKEWRKPAAFIDGEGQKYFGPERIDRAHDAISMFKTVMGFMVSLRKSNNISTADCKQILNELEHVRFEKGGSREQEMTFQQVSAFIAKALEMGDRGIIPADRGLYMAIGVAAQFETLLRQKDIIGAWEPMRADMRIPDGMHTVREPGALKERGNVERGGRIWCGYFAWENLPGWRWRIKTSKSKYRTAVDFDLKNYGLLMPLLEAVPHDQRMGPVVKGEHGLPVRERSYQRWFRQIARAAGIPDDVWNMDTRAGGATEAYEEAGADMGAVQAALTHSSPRMTQQYIRRRSSQVASVADMRQRSRTGSDDSGTG